MLELPPVDPPIGLSTRVRLGRDHYVRVDSPRHPDRYDGEIFYRQSWKVVDSR
ncbi:hypothetical protein FAGKG844_130008 [Frankia sp. AgKG'84/4]